MSFALTTITEAALLAAALLAAALSIDTLTTGLAYGSKKIKIPFASVMIINVVCSAILVVSLFAGSKAGTFLPD